MTTRTLKNRPRVAAALQLALLLGVFQGVVATTPSLPPAADADEGAVAVVSAAAVGQPAR